jgi:predicted nuclease of restriction endonuclease-like (RecB) superfamily
MGSRSSKRTDPHSSIAPAERGGIQKSGGEIAGLPAGYGELLGEIKARIARSRIEAALAANHVLIDLYWHIGRSIVERQKLQGWGKSVVERLAADIQSAFPGISGFSRQNIWTMRAFYLAYTKEITILLRPVRELPDANLSQPVRELNGVILPQPVAESNGENLPSAMKQIPWGHNLELIFKLKDPAIRLWYAQKTLEHGWSRAVLVHQIKSRLYERQGSVVTNFDAALPPAQSDLAKQAIKDPYVFDFLTMSGDAAERDLERGLVEHIRKFLLELGVGFAFVGSQYHIEVAGDDFYIDLLFYHLRLRCFVVIDLKAGAFKPEDAGKMSFYLAAVDDALRHPDDEPSIGIILCGTKKRLIAEYALRNMSAPIGVSEYRLATTLPEDLKGSLPSVEELESELRKSRER